MPTLKDRLFLRIRERNAAQLAGHAPSIVRRGHDFDTFRKVRRDLVKHMLELEKSFVVTPSITKVTVWVSRWTFSRLHHRVGAGAIMFPPRANIRSCCTSDMKMGSRLA